MHKIMETKIYWIYASFLLKDHILSIITIFNTLETYKISHMYFITIYEYSSKPMSSYSKLLQCYSERLLAYNPPIKGYTKIHLSKSKRDHPYTLSRHT